MNVLSIASRPFVYLLAGSTALLLRILGQRESTALPKSRPWCGWTEAG